MLFLLLLACSPKGTAPLDSAPAADTAAPADSAPADSAPADSAPADSGTPCDLAWSGVLEIAVDGQETQIHGTSTTDGERIWMAWAIPNDSNTFDVWLAALGCGGEVEIPPRAVTDGPDNELDPSLAVSGDRLLVTWGTSTDAGLGVRSRVYTLDGEPAGDAFDLEATRAGVPVTGNATLARVAARAEGFVMAGSWGHDDAEAFQAFHVLLDRDGAPVGDAVDAELDTENGQTYVDLSVSGDDVVLAWQEDSTTSTQPTAAWSYGALADPGARPAVSGDWAAWDDNAGAVWVRTPAGDVVDLGLSGFAHSPRLVDGDPPLLLTMTIDSSIYNTLQLHALSADGSADTIDLAATAAPSVYGVDLTRIDDANAVVVWQEGENPDFRLYAEWIALP